MQPANGPYGRIALERRPGSLAVQVCWALLILGILLLHLDVLFALDSRKPSYPFAVVLLGVVVFVLGRGLLRFVRVALQPTGWIEFTPERLELSFDGKWNACHWHEIARIEALRGVPRDHPDGVMVSLAGPANLPVRWLLIPDQYRIGRDALAEAMETARLAALATEAAPRRASGAVAKAVATQERDVLALASSFLWVPLLCLVLALLLRR